MSNGVKRPAALLALAVLFIGIGLFAGARKYLLLAHAERIVARIDSIDSSNPGRRVVDISFTSKNGSTHHAAVVVNRESVTSGRVHNGGTLPIVFDPSNPNDVSRDGFWPLWTLPVIFFLGGISLFIAAVINKTGK